jgi:hypothetical protein
MLIQMDVQKILDGGRLLFVDNAQNSIASPHNLRNFISAWMGMI